MSKKVLFIDRDGTLVIEPPVDYQLDSLEKLEFYPKVMRNLGFIRSKLDFEFAMVTNQDGLGTASFPEETFWPAHNLMMKTLEGEGITFDEIFIDRSMPEDMAPTRKPRTGMLTKYLNNPEYDLAGSFVIGDRPTDVELAKNLGCRAKDRFFLRRKPEERQRLLFLTQRLFQILSHRISRNHDLIRRKELLHALVSDTNLARFLRQQLIGHTGI